MSDLDHYATRRELAAVSGMGLPTYTVGPAASGAAFTTVQEAADQAKVDIDAGTISAGLVLVHPGTYLEDVLLTAGIYVASFGGPESVIIRSLTWSNSSVASVAAFNASGAFTDLATGAYTAPPLVGGAEGVTLYRDAAAAAWHDNADFSLRLLGFKVANGTFLNTQFIVSNCRILKASGSAAGQGGIVGCYGNQLEIENSLVTGGMLFSQYAVKSVAHATFLGTGMIDDTYDSTADKPVTAFSPTVLIDSHIAGELEINGDTCDFAASGCYIGSIDDNCTAAGSASTVDNCHVAGAIDNANALATIVVTGGYTAAAVSGAGAAGVTITANAVQADLVPLVDNADDLGTTAKRFAEAHIASIQAHLDATNAAKATLTGDTLQVKGTKFDVAFTSAVADSAGYAHGIEAGTGGVASAVAGGTGGAATTTGGLGGAGTAGLLSGAGGNVNLVGGAAGANGGFGGNNGGNVTLKGGAATGAGTAGKVQVGLTNTSGIDVGTTVASDTDNTDDLGTTALAFKAVHARSLVAHADATDTSKTTVAAATITPTVAHSMKPTAAADTVAGKNETVTSGDGGAATAGAAGGVGGTATFSGGVGGAGSAAQIAGAGGAVAVTGGAAGAAAAAGGANGGDVAINGGAGTGAGTKGRVITTSAFIMLAIAKAGRAALGLGAGQAGACIFCTDAGPAGVGIPLWWDGVAWRDAAGNVVA